MIMGVCVISQRSSSHHDILIPLFRMQLALVSRFLINLREVGSCATQSEIARFSGFTYPLFRSASVLSGTDSTGHGSGEGESEDQASEVILDEIHVDVPTFEPSSEEVRPKRSCSPV